jgi:hypothetical protein
MADLSYSDYARKMGGDRARRAYTSFRDAMDNHYSQLDQVIRPPTPVQQTQPGRGAMSPLGGQAVQPVRLARGGRVEGMASDVRRLARKYGGRP